MTKLLWSCIDCGAQGPVELTEGERARLADINGRIAKAHGGKVSVTLTGGLGGYLRPVPAAEQPGGMVELRWMPAAAAPDAVPGFEVRHVR